MKQKNKIIILSIVVLLQGSVLWAAQEKGRSDQSIEGNAGYIVGEPMMEEPAIKVKDIPVKEAKKPAKKVLHVKVRNQVYLPKSFNPISLIKKMDNWTKEYLW